MMKSLNYGTSSKWSREMFYVSIENFEQIKEDSYQIFFDGIQAKELNFFNSRSLLDSYDEIIPYLFSIIVTEEQFKEIRFFFKNAIYKSRWFQLIITERQTSMPTSFIIDNYINDDDNPQEKFISSITQLHSNSSINKILNIFFSWNHFKLSSREEIKDSLIKPLEDFKDFGHKLNIYDVGQGNLSAITNADDVPLLYFDIGGGFAWNKATYPNTLKLCFTYTKIVVISHWDNDHLKTAKRYFTNDPIKLDGITWIAPQQVITASFFKLAAKMNVSGNLIIWPTSLKGSMPFWFGQLIKCNGPDKNHSGLATIITSPNNSIKSILHPADAAYKYIPGIKKIKFDGLVATHHGANFDDQNFPVPNSENGNIAYSYGLNNTYSHPKILAHDAHSTNNWINIRNTINGNISFTLDPNNVTIPCIGNCDLAISQTY